MNQEAEILEDVDMTQYLSFALGEEKYAVEVQDVREVIGVTGITRVPRMPDFMLGVINLRGSVVPVVDLRLKFGMPKGEVTVDSCIIILEIKDEDATTLVGGFVDSVREVIELGDDQMEPTPRMGRHTKAEFIQGMGKTDQGFLILLDIMKIFRNVEMTYLWQEEAVDGEE